MPPKKRKKFSEVPIIYPPGVDDITSDLSDREIRRRLWICINFFDDMNIKEDCSMWTPLAIHLTNKAFFKHSNKHVRLTVACCLLMILEALHSDNSYEDTKLKNTIDFILNQLKDFPSSFNDDFYEDYCVLLKILSENQPLDRYRALEGIESVFCELFSLLFTIISGAFTTEVKDFISNIMVNTIKAMGATVPEELLTIVFKKLVESRISATYRLARDVLKMTSEILENSVISYLLKAEFKDKVFDVFYELSFIYSSKLLWSLVPNIDLKLKSKKKEDRLGAVRLLAKMFSDINSKLANEHPSLWFSFLGRFNDISQDVRMVCVMSAEKLLLNHPNLRSNLTEHLQPCQYDPNKNIRKAVVMVIVKAASTELLSVNDSLLAIVAERTLDEEFEVCRPALIGLSKLYRSYMSTPSFHLRGISKAVAECILSVKNMAMHWYYRSDLDDRLLSETIFRNYLVPYDLRPEEKAKRLYHFYASIDYKAVKCLSKQFKSQNEAREHWIKLLELYQQDRSDEVHASILQILSVLAKSLSEEVKSLDALKRFDKLIMEDDGIRESLGIIMKPDCFSLEAEKNVKGILQKLENPQSDLFKIVKRLLDRVAPLLFDKFTVMCLVFLVEKVLNEDLDIIEEIESRSGLVEEELSEDSEIIEEIRSCSLLKKGLKLLTVIAYFFPAAFESGETYISLISFLSDNYNEAGLVEHVLQIFSYIGNNIQLENPDIAKQLVQFAYCYAVEGTPKEAKRAIMALNSLASESTRESLFKEIIEISKDKLYLECPLYCTALVSIGHIAHWAPSAAITFKEIIAKNILEELIYQDRGEPSWVSTDESWCDEAQLSVETQAKRHGMKLIVRWLLRNSSTPVAAGCALRLFTCLIENDGDRLKRGVTSQPDMAWLKVTAGCCILKLIRRDDYAELFTNKQFQSLSRLIVDDILPLKIKFARKLFKWLIAKELPLKFAIIFCLDANEENKKFGKRLQEYYKAVVKSTKDQDTNGKNAKHRHPETIISYAIHMLAHHPDFDNIDQLDVAENLKKCLWFLLEPLVTHEIYSFWFMKTVILEIKLTKDVQDMENDVQNKKLYAICDMALDQMFAKTKNILIADFPMEPTLPTHLFKKT